MGGFRLGKIFGIEIDIDWSWIFIFLFISWNLAFGLFPALHPDWGTLLSGIVGIGASLLFFASVLAHELAHSLIAKRRGIPVRSITLFLFGGVSDIEKEPGSPEAEFSMAVVGPLTSVILGVVFLIIGGLAAGSLADIIDNPGASLSRLGPVPSLLVWLGPVNILVGLFNLLPGFPLDGGRILRAAIWALNGDLLLSTRYASAAGQGIALLFILAGVLMIFGVQVPVLGTGVAGGVWLIFIGLFLNSAAALSYRQLVKKRSG